MAFFANCLPKHPNEHCEAFLEFLGSSQVATLNDVENHCDNLIRSYTENTITCKYCELNSKFELENKSKLFILHANIRSLQKQYEFLNEIIANLDLKPDIICLSESRVKLDGLLSKLELTGYDLLLTNPRKTAGGVGVYIYYRVVKHNLNYRVVKHNWLGIDECEDICLNVVEPSANSIINVIVLYRHPNTCKKKFILKLDEALDEQPFANTTTYILGDVNLDINKFNRFTLAQNYLNGLISKGFFPLITQPTRVTDTSASIIDHIITNDLSHKLIPGIIGTDD